MRCQLRSACGARSVPEVEPPPVPELLVDGAIVPGDDMLPGAVDGDVVDDGGVDGCCMFGVVDGVGVFIIDPLPCPELFDGVVLVWAETKPTVPTIVAAAMAEIRVLEAFIVNLLVRRESNGIKTGRLAISWFDSRAAGQDRRSADLRHGRRTSEVTK